MAVCFCIGLLSLCQGNNFAYGVSLQEGLISYFPLDEGTGTTANDAGPAGSVADNGTLRNGPAWIDGKFNAGVQFNGTDQDILIPASTDMDINTYGVTLSAWVKLDYLPADSPVGFSGIYDSSTDDYIFYLDRGQNELRFKATTATGGAERPGIPANRLNTSDWHHIMGVFDGVEGTNEIYVNGTLADRHSNVGLRELIRAGQLASIGGQPGVDPPNEVTNAFGGGVSDVAIWNRPLGLAEAQYLYNEGVGNAVGAANPNITPAALPSPVQPTAQPIVYYKFDGNLDNHGTGGSALNATLHDAPGRNDTLYTTTTNGQGVNLSENPASTSSNDEEGDYFSVDYKLPDSGTIAMEVSINTLFNYQTLWANSAGGNDWESWIYGDGRIAARADNGTTRMEHNVFLFEDQLAPHHYAFSWERDGDSLESSLYIDGKFQGLVVDDWQEPGETFFLAGGAGNHLGSAIYDEVRIYNTRLTEEEILYLSMNAPETVFLTGDYNGDGAVNAADYTVWRDTLDETVASGTGADGNGDGTINAEDYTIWKDNYGRTASTPASSVPEPASCLLVVLSCGVLGYGRRR